MRDRAGVTGGGVGRARRVTACRSCGRRVTSQSGAVRVAPTDPRHGPWRRGPGSGEGAVPGDAHLLLAVRHLPTARRFKPRWSPEPHSAPATAFSLLLLSCLPACPPAMASLKDLEGRWRLTESQGFEEYMKELGEDTPPKPRVLTRVLASPSTTRPGELRGAPRGC